MAYNTKAQNIMVDGYTGVNPFEFDNVTTFSVVGNAPNGIDVL